jgi:hypothetical protein
LFPSVNAVPFATNLAKRWGASGWGFSALHVSTLRFGGRGRRTAEQSRSAFLAWLRAALEHDAQTRPRAKISLSAVRFLALPVDPGPPRAAEEILPFSDHAPRRWDTIDDQAMTKAA